MSHSGGATNPYQVLGVPHHATKDEIRRQYKKLALKYHPDKNTSAGEGARQHAERMFKAVSHAYEILMNDDARSRYDRYAAEGGDDDGGHTRTHQQQRQQQPHRRSGVDEYGGTGGSRGFFHGGGVSSLFDDDPFFSSAFRSSGFVSGGGGVHHRRGGDGVGSLFGGGFFDDFFNAVPLEHCGGRRGGSGQEQQRRRHPFSAFFESFAFQDPFQLFEEMMNDDLRMMNSMRGAQRMMPQALPYEMTASGGRRSTNHAVHSVFDDFFSGGHTQQQQQQQQRSSQRGGGVRMQSISTVTEVKNGQRVTKTIRRTQDERGIVTEDVDEEVANVSATPPHHRSIPFSGAGRSLDWGPGQGSGQMTAPIRSYAYY